MLRSAFAALVPIAALALAAPAAFAQQVEEPSQPSAPAPDQAPPLPAEIPPLDVQNLPSSDGAQPPPSEPQAGDPTEPAPPGASSTDPNALDGSATSSVSSPSDGQWVFTAQYGWIWVPYAQAYTYVVPGGNPYMFVFGLGLGWRWVFAPWIDGWGPQPYWGHLGPTPFYWYRHPWFRVPPLHRWYGFHSGPYSRGYGHPWYGHPGYFAPGYPRAAPVHPGPMLHAAPGHPLPPAGRTFHGVPHAAPHVGGSGGHGGHRH